MLSNAYARDSFKPSNVSKNWRMALFLFSQLALSSTIQGEGSTSSVSTKIANPAASLKKKETKKTTYSQEVANSKKGHSDTKSRGKLDIPGINHLSGSAHVGQTGLLQSLQRFTNQNQSHGDISKTAQQHGSYRLIEAQPVGVIEQVFLTEVPEEQIVLFPDNQLRFLGGVQDEFEDGFGLSELVQVDLGSGYGESGYDLSLEDGELIEQFEILPGYSGNDGVPIRNHGEYSNVELTKIEEKLDYLIQEVASGHKITPNTNYHFEKGTGKELNVLAIKVEELIKAVGGISKQNQVIDRQTSKTYSISAKTLNEVTSLNEKLEQLRHGISQISEEQQHTTERQNIAIVKSSKDITEINSRLTDLLRAVGRLGKDGSFQIESGYNNRGNNHNIEHESELREVRTSIRGLQSALESITSELNSVIGKITKITKNDNSITRLQNELSQVRSLLESSIEQNRTFGKKEIESISEVLQSQKTNFGNLSQKIARLAEALNSVTNEVRSGNTAEGEHSERIYREIKELGGRLKESYSSISSLIQKETSLISEYHLKESHEFSGKNVGVITSELNSLKDLIQKIASQQINLVQYTDTDNKNPKSQYAIITNLLLRIQKECEELVQGQQNILNKSQSGKIPNEFLRDIKGVTRAIMALKSVTERLFEEQAVLIKSKSPYGDDKWTAFNDKLVKVDKIFQSLTQQNLWLQQQSGLITKLDGNLVDFGKRIEYLVEEQRKLINFKGSKPGYNSINVDERQVVISVENLRTVVQNLVSSQKTLIEQYRNPSTPKELAKDIGSINYRLADISSIIDRLTKVQVELVNRYGKNHQDSDGDGSNKAIGFLSSQVNRLVEIVELIAKQQRSLIDGKAVNIDFNSLNGKFSGLNSRLGKLGERVSVIIKQQESIFDRLSNDQSEKYNDLRGILSQLRDSVIGLVNQENITIREGGNGKFSDKIQKEIDVLEELTTKIYQVIEKVAAEQQQILNNENGQSENIDQINGKITRLGSIMTLVLEQQKRLFSGGFKVPDYSKDIRKLNGQLIALKETTSRMIELQESSLKNAENSSLGDLNTLGKQLNLVRQAIEQLFSGQERVLEVVGKEETSQKILQNEGRLAQRVEQLTYLVQKLAEDQVRLLGNFKPGSGNAKGDLRGLVNRLGKLDEIIRILNTQQDYTIRLLDLVPVIREEGADIKKINGQMGTLRKLLHDLVALEKNDLAVDQETLEYVKGTAGRLSKVYEDIEKMFNGQKELLRYLQSSSSIRGIGEVREMSRKIYMLTEATRIVLNEVKSSLSQVEGSTKFIAQNTQQINAKINRLSSVINGVAEKQNILLKQITQLSQSQNKNFRVVNQRLNTLGKDINQLAYQQKQLLGKYGNDIEKIFGITDDKLSELRKTIEVMVNEQRKLVYFISEGNTIKSKEVLQELSKLDGGMNQLMKFVRGLLEQQNKLLAYTQEDNSMLKEHGEELRVFGEQFNKLYNLVTMVAETQKHLITREEVVNLFKQQNGNIKSLSLELAEISNQIVQLLNQQKAVLGNERGQNEELNQLRKVLSLVSESIRKVLVQQNVLLQGGWNKVPKELLNDINALRSQFMGLSKVVVQISDRQNYLIQQQNGDTKYIIEDIGQVKKNLSGLSQLVEKIAQFQLSIIKRGGLTPEQAQDLKYIKSELGNLDNKVAYLVEQQQKLVAIISKDGQMDNEKFARIVQNLAELRKTIYQLTSQQTSVLSQKFDEALRQKIPAEIAQLNGKLLGLNKDVDQVLGLQKELFVQSSKDTSLIVDRVGSLDARLEQLGAYVKELFLEQKTVLLNNSKLLEQNLIKTDLLTREVRNLDQKIQNLVRIQFDLLKRISADRTTDSKETTNILQRLSGLQSLISQLIEQQKKLLSISSTGRVPEPILRRLALLNEKYSQLVEIVNQLTSKQNTLVELSRDSNATGHQLEGQVSEVNKRLLGLFDFIKQTFAEQTKVLNTREITAFLRDQNHRIAGLGVKLSELGNQFDKMINEQGLIIKQIGQASSEDSKRDRAIAVELGSLREVMRKLIESQRSLLGPEIAARVGEEVSKIISNLNDRMAQVGMVIRSVREEQTTIVKLLGEGGNYQKMEGRFAQLRQQFAQMAGWIKQMAVEQSKLLQRDEVMSILKEQTGDIRLIKSKLTQFKNDIIRIVEIQNVLLHETKAANQNDQARDTELAKRLGELRELTEGIVNIQQVVLNSDIYKIIPKETLLRVKEINARLEKLGPITFELLNQQKSLLELTSVEKRGVCLIWPEVDTIVSITLLEFECF
ncbi:hypothetical protein K7432_008919 [Basidiobolus ranarum]|uniref:Uncharacterized protein n=1 Tax=Basidiobolus ranarum TaxID=34480 RepID=A0ABR2VXY5_9FUNG